MTLYEYLSIGLVISGIIVYFHKQITNLKKKQENDTVELAKRNEETQAILDLFMEFMGYKYVEKSNYIDHEEARNYPPEMNMFAFTKTIPAHFEQLSQGTLSNAYNLIYENRARINNLVGTIDLIYNPEPKQVASSIEEFNKVSKPTNPKRKSRKEKQDDNCYV